jgi:hypothetical protein
VHHSAWQPHSPEGAISPPGWRFEVADRDLDHSSADVDGPVLVFAVKPAKVLAFGKGEFSYTRYRPS